MTYSVAFSQSNLSSNAVKGKCLKSMKSKHGFTKSLRDFHKLTHNGMAHHANYDLARHGIHGKLHIVNRGHLFSFLDLHRSNQV